VKPVTDGPLFAAALYTGLRKGELRALRKERGLILVRRSRARATTKGGHADAVPVHPELMAFPRHAIESSPSPLVFAGHDGEMFAEDTDLRRSEDGGARPAVRRGERIPHGRSTAD
jgi:integrase